jgi:predicted ATPase
MISELRLKNFKTHKDTTLNLANLNLMTGMNGMGKSSVIQALLLLRQSYQKRVSAIGLALVGDLCNLGYASDCLYFEADSNNIEFGVIDKSGEFNYSFDVDPYNANSTLLKGKNTLPNADYSNILNNSFQYISAFRNGPLEDFKKDTAVVEANTQISHKEGRCEFIAHYLHHFRDHQVDEALLHSPGQNRSLLFQVEQWMQEISPNIQLHIEASKEGYKLNYSYKMGNGNTPTFKSTNVGFGISYVLPIVVATLKAGGYSLPDHAHRLIIVENPEAQVHPSGQSKLMELISKAAQLGVQFIIETQSDHIINGLLVSAKKGLIDHDKTSVHFFDRDKDSHAIVNTPLVVTKTGRLKNAPKGFFDQFDKDMSTLMGF